MLLWNIGICGRPFLQESNPVGRISLTYLKAGFIITSSETDLYIYSIPSLTGGHSGTVPFHFNSQFLYFKRK